MQERLVVILPRLVNYSIFRLTESYYLVYAVRRWPYPQAVDRHSHIYLRRWIELSITNKAAILSAPLFMNAHPQKLTITANPYSRSLLLVLLPWSAFEQGPLGSSNRRKISHVRSLPSLHTTGAASVMSKPNPKMASNSCLDLCSDPGLLKSWQETDSPISLTLSQPFQKDHLDILFSPAKT